jgi:CheY-like chemotaxis protein
MKRVGLEVQEARSGTEALQKWQTWHPHLVWLDIRMPDMSGYEVAQQIRVQEESSVIQPASSVEPEEQRTEDEGQRTKDKRQKTILIALTAQSYQEDHNRALAAGFTDFVTKPFDATEIFRLLVVHLGLQFQYSTPPDSRGSMPPDAIASSPSDEQPLTPEMLRIMPPEWIEALYTAALNCSSQAVETQIALLPPDQRALAARLKRLVHNYEFEVILRLASPQEP